MIETGHFFLPSELPGNLLRHSVQIVAVQPLHFTIPPAMTSRHTAHSAAAAVVGAGAGTGGLWNGLDGSEGSTILSKQIWKI